MSETAQFVIEQYTAGFLSGWYYENSSLPTAKCFQIEVNGLVVGVGETTIFRQDLKNAGYGDGVHAFRIFLDDKLVEYGKLNLRLRNQSGSYAAGNTFEFIREEPNITLALRRRDPLNLHFDVLGDKEKLSSRIQINAGNKILHLQSTQSSIKTGKINIPAPIELMDGIERLITIGSEGSSRALWQGHITFYPVVSSREKLTSTHPAHRQIGINAQSSYRYESLQLQLAQSSSIEAIKNIQLAHAVINEGWENRSEFPQLALTKADSPLVSVVIPAYNQFAITYHCIASLILAYNHVSFEVILADDCSNDRTKEAEKYIEHLQVCRNNSNLMFLKNCNKASQMCKGEYIVLLNNDTEVTSHWLDELVSTMTSHSQCGLTGSKLLNQNGSLQEAGGIVWSSGKPWNVGHGDNPNKPEYNYVRHVDYVSGASLCIRRDVWTQVSGFNEDYAPAYFEDTDIAFRVREAGYSTLYTPSSEVFHFEGLTHGRDINVGVKQNQVVNQAKFARQWVDAVQHNGHEAIENLQKEKDRNIQKRVLVLDFTVPSPNEEAGAYAAVQEIRLMQSLGCKVTFADYRFLHMGELTTELQKMGVEVLHAPFYTSVEQMLTQRLPEMDAVYITRYYVAQKFVDRIKSINPALPILFNNADLHFLRELRAAQTEQQKAKALETRDQELEICKKVDAVLCYNAVEHAVISSHITEKLNYHVTPWVLNEKTKGPEFSQRHGISFLGGFGHKPNIDSVIYLAEKVMPLLLSERPDIKLNVYGSKMPPELNELACENINIVGFAANLDDVFHQHKVFVAPLLSGAGIKGKVLEAMAYNLPCVLTDIAAEATGLSNQISCSIANTPETTVEKIIELYDDEKLWNQYAAAERKIVTAHYSARNAREKFADIFASVGVFVGVKNRVQ